MIAFAPVPLASSAAEARTARFCSFSPWSSVKPVCGDTALPHRSWKPSAFAITRLCISTHSAGYFPTAASPLSITASQPSMIAFATSLHSARVGVGHEIMDSIICVATMTGLPSLRAFMIMSFWWKGTSSGGVSTPRSPLATMAPSDSCRILSRSSSACGFSIFAKILGAFPSQRRMSSRSSTMSSWRCTKDSPTQSMSCPQMKLRSFLSFSVMGEMGSTTSGVFTPFFALSLPPTSTSHSMNGGHSVMDELGLCAPCPTTTSLPSHV
mmetsp:Transcript_19717/g.52329  ORF Transcript_19717/g.52329 Transcript_19717/m.52329 type:complete len:268 (+) Transcript_19717:419-1222(+)